MSRRWYDTTAQRARLGLIAFQVPLAVAPLLLTVVRNSKLLPARDIWIPVALTVALFVIQLRHSLAAADGVRPPGAFWSYLALLAVVYAPWLWWGESGWVAAQVFLVASAPMLVRGFAGASLVAAHIAIPAVLAAAPLAGNAPLEVALYVPYTIGLTCAVVGLSLFGATRLVRTAQELATAREELADLAIRRDRLRISRDLHDLLGQSLSAVSLKGDLAIRLLGTDPVSARAEVTSLTQVARDALRGIKAITRNEHSVSLGTEIDGAAALLSAAGIRADIEVDVPDLPPASEEVLAWGVREGVTNLVRHSNATKCRIIGTESAASARIEIINDGVASRHGARPGQGVAGLRVRAEAVGGAVEAEPLSDGRFRLCIEVPKKVT